MPFLISSPRIKNTFSAPALATATKGTKRPRTIFVLGDNPFIRGTRALRPRATLQEAETARRYDCMIACVESGLDLLAFALFIATFKD